jgi:hypothetical protein
MSVSIPQPFKTSIVSPVTIDGIPETFHIDITHVPTIFLNVENIPVIHLSIDHIPKIQLGVDKILLGVDPVEIRLTELPKIRGHLPADFNVGLNLMGMELMNIRLCGEAQIITEPFVPNPCETCGPTFTPNPTPPPTPTPAPAQPGTPASVDPATGLRAQRPRRRG